jgi:hypothetical protein
MSQGRAHVIETLEFEVAFRNEADAWAHHSRLEDFAAQRAPNVIAEVFDEFSDGRDVWRLERLEVDLGVVPPDEPADGFEARLRAAVRRALGELAPPAGAAGRVDPAASLATVEQVDADRLWGLVRLGRLPWQVGRMETADLQALARRVLERDGPAFAEALRTHPDMPRLVARIARTWSPDHLEHLRRLLAPEGARLGATAPADPDGRPAQAWERALLAAAAADATPEVLAEQAARRAFREALREGRVQPATTNAMVRRDPDLVRIELRELARKPEPLARLARTLTQPQWRELLALFAMPADAEFLAGLVEEPWPWRLDERQSLAAVAQALRAALLAYMLDAGEGGLTAATAVAEFVRAAAEVDDRPAAEAAALVAARWPTEGPLAEAGLRLRPLLLAWTPSTPATATLPPDIAEPPERLAGQRLAVTETAVAPPSRRGPGDLGAHDPTWDRLAAQLDAASLDRAGWEVLHARAPDWLRQRLRRIGRSAAWRAAFTVRLDAARLTQLIVLWLAPEDAAWLAAVTFGAGDEVTPGAAGRQALAARWLLDETLLSGPAPLTTPGLVEALARRQAQAQARSLAEAARELAAGLAARAPSSEPARLALERLAALAASDAPPRLADAPAAAAGPDGASPPRMGTAPAGPVEPSRLRDRLARRAASAEWRQALADSLSPRRLETLFGLWLDPEDARGLAALATAPPQADDGPEPDALVMARRWITAEVLLGQTAARTVADVVQGAVQRAAQAEGESPEAVAVDWAARWSARPLEPAVRARLAASLGARSTAQVAEAAPLDGSAATGEGGAPPSLRDSGPSPAGPPGPGAGSEVPLSPAGVRADQAQGETAGGPSPPSPQRSPPRAPGADEVSLSGAVDAGDDIHAPGPHEDPPAPIGARPAAPRGGDPADATDGQGASSGFDAALPSMAEGHAEGGPPEADLPPPTELIRLLTESPEPERRAALLRVRPGEAQAALALLERLETAWRRALAAGPAPASPRLGLDRAWSFVAREFVEEDRVFEPTGFAERWFAALTAGAPAADVRRWREAMIAALGQPPLLAELADDDRPSPSAGTPAGPSPDRFDAALAAAPAATAAWPWLASVEPAPGEAIYVPNAGLVLAGPYIAPLLDRLGLTRDGAFPDEASAWRAVDVLQLIVNDGEPAPEHELVFNKLLCGIELTAPLERYGEISAAERELVDGLLEVMIQRWSILGSTSSAGLRQTFLQRAGVLRDEIEAWSLVVEPGPFDMLLDEIPWGFRTLKLPWMPQVLHVDWR